MGDSPKIKVGITGQSGFIGTHLSGNLSRFGNTFSVVPFERSFFEQQPRLIEFVEQCDLIIHLAFINRHPCEQFLYEGNINLARKLADAIEKANHLPSLWYGSSIREGENTAYGQSKQVSREILESVVTKKSGYIESFRIPNVFGPGAKPYDNSFIATFSRQLLTSRKPVITEEREIPLLYVESLCRYLQSRILSIPPRQRGVFITPVEPDFQMPAREVLSVLQGFRQEQLKNGTVRKQTDWKLEKFRDTFLSHAE